MKKKDYHKWRKEMEAFQKSLEPKPVPWWKQTLMFLGAWIVWALLWLGLFWAVGDALKGIHQ